MRLVTFFPAGSETTTIGALSSDGSLIVDLRRASIDLQEKEGKGQSPTAMPDDMIEFLRQGAPAIKSAERALSHGLEAAVATAAAGDVRICSPLPRPNSIRDFMLVEEHVRGSFKEVPAEWYEIPVYWKVNADTVFGPEDPIRWPCYTQKLDFELELAAVIGRTVDAVSVEEAQECIAGYTIFNDWSARDIQMRELKVGLGPGLGKDFATSIGPCLATPDELDPISTRMVARINGEVWSDGTLGAMRFSFPEVIAHLSAEQILQPGDVIASGTIARGCGLELDRWLQVGDVVELEVDGIGILRNTITAPEPNRRKNVRDATVQA